MEPVYAQPFALAHQKSKGVNLLLQKPNKIKTHNDQRHKSQTSIKSAFYQNTNNESEYQKRTILTSNSLGNLHKQVSFVDEAQRVNTDHSSNYLALNLPLKDDPKPYGNYQTSKANSAQGIKRPYRSNSLATHLRILPGQFSPSQSTDQSADITTSNQFYTVNKTKLESQEKVTQPVKLIKTKNANHRIRLLKDEDQYRLRPIIYSKSTARLQTSMMLDPQLEKPENRNIETARNPSRPRQSFASKHDYQQDQPSREKNMVTSRSQILQKYGSIEQREKELKKLDPFPRKVDSRSQDGDSIYPYKTSDILADTPLVLKSDANFEKAIQRAHDSRQDPIPENRKIATIMNTSKGIVQRKILQVQKLFDDEMSVARAEYIDKVSTTGTLPGIQAVIDEQLKKKGAYRFNPNAAPRSDFQVLGMPKIESYRDHNGFHISKTGHKIDNYNFKAQKQFEEEQTDETAEKQKLLTSRLAAGKQVKFKESLFKKFEQVAKEHIKASDQMTSTQQEIDDRHSMIQSRSRFRSQTSMTSSFYREMTPEQKKRANMKNGLTYFESCEIENYFTKQKPFKKSVIKKKDQMVDNFKPSRKYNDIDKDSDDSLISNQAEYKMNLQEENMDRQQKIVEEKKQRFNSIENQFMTNKQKKQADKIISQSAVMDKNERERSNYFNPVTVKDIRKSKDIIKSEISDMEMPKFWRQTSQKDERMVKGEDGIINKIGQNLLGQQPALIAYLDTVYSANQTPSMTFTRCLINDKFRKSTNMTLRLQGKINDATADGLSNALQVYGKQIQCVEFESPGLNDAGMSTILKAAINQGAIAYCFRDCRVDEKVIETIKSAFNSRNTPDEVQTVVHPRGLEIINCRVDFMKFPRLFNFVLDEQKDMPQDLQAVKEMSPSQARQRTKVSFKELEAPPTNTKVKKQVIEANLNQNYSCIPLEEIKLVGLRMSNCEFLYPVISESPYLKTLDISNNTFPRGKLWPLLSNMVQSMTLKYINLSYCNFKKIGIKILSEYFRFSISLLVVDLSYSTMEDPKGSLEQLFLGVSDSQTIQSLHLKGLSNILNIEDIHYLEKEILEIDEKPVHTRNVQLNLDFFDAQHSEITEQDSEYSKELNEDLIVEERESQKTNSKKSENKQTTEVQEDSPVFEQNKGQQKQQQTAQHESPRKSVNSPMIRRATLQGAPSFNLGDDENFSVIKSDNLIYTRQLAGRHFGFPDSISQKWRKTSSCWITDKSVLTILICKVSSVFEPLAPSIEVVAAQEKVTDENQQMQSIKEILPHFREKEFSSKYPNLNYHEINLNRAVLAFKVWSARFGFSPSIFQLPFVKEKEDMMTDQNSPEKIRIFATCLILKPNTKYDVLLNGKKATQVSVFERKSQVQTMINDIHYLRHISKGGSGNKSKFAARQMKKMFTKLIEKEVNKDSKDTTPKGSKKKSKPAKKSKDKAREETYLQNLLHASHFWQLKDLFKVKKGIDLTMYEFKMLPDHSTLASEYKYQLEEAFENDFNTADIYRIINDYGDHDKIGVVDARKRKIKFYLKKAYPTIVEMFNYELATTPWDIAQEYYPTIKSSAVLEIILRRQLNPKTALGLKFLKTFKNMSEKIRSYLNDKEKNDTRNRMIAGFASLRKLVLEQQKKNNPKNSLLKLQTKQKSTLATNPTNSWLNKKDLSKLYLKRSDGFRRAQFLELIVRLAMEYFPKFTPDKALYEYLLQIFPRIPDDNFEDKPVLKKYNMVGKTAYRARYFLTPQLDTVLYQNKYTIQKLIKRMDMHMGMHLKMNSVNFVFGNLFPTFKAEIHACFVTSMRIVSEERDTREAHFRLTKPSFYEFLIRLSRYVVCGSSTYNYISFDGIPLLYAAKSFVPEDFVEPETEEQKIAREAEERKKRLYTKRKALVEPPKYDHVKEEKKDAEAEDAGIAKNEEGYLPYHVTLDILFRQIEQKLQYL